MHLYLFCFFVCLFVCFVFFFRATSAAYGGSQARSPIRTVAADLHHSHSNTGSEPRLQPTPQLMAMPDPQNLKTNKIYNIIGIKAFLNDEKLFMMSIPFRVISTTFFLPN